MRRTAVSPEKDKPALTSVDLVKLDYWPPKHNSCNEETGQFEPMPKVRFESELENGRNMPKEHRQGARQPADYDRRTPAGQSRAGCEENQRRCHQHDQKMHHHVCGKKMMIQMSQRRNHG